MTKAPTLTIGIPTYNNSAFLKKTLAAVSKMLSPEVVCVVNDNASTDSTQKVAREFCRKNRRIRYYRNKTNEGMYPNFDWVVKRSRSDYVLLLSDDDSLSQEGVRRVLQVIRDNPGIPVVKMNVRSRDYERDISGLAGDTIMDVHQFVRHNPYAAGGVSGTVVNRKMWLATECKTRHDLTLMEKCLRMAAQRKKGVYIIYEPFIDIYIPTTGRRWASDPLKTFRLIYVLQPSIHLGLVKDGQLERSDLNWLFEVTTAQMHLYLVNMLGCGSFIDKATVGDLVRIYGRQPVFWLLCPIHIPLLVLPRPLQARAIGALKKAYQFTKRRPRQ